MEAVAALERLGGAAATGPLLELVTRRRLDAAVRSGDIRRARRGYYLLTEPEERSRGDAVRVGGTVSHLSAAVLHGWAVKWPTERTWLTVPRGHTVAASGLHLAWSDLPPEQVVDGRTAPLRTVLDCARRLPFDEALAVADSALRADAVGRVELAEAAAALRGPGSRQVRRVALAADGRAANPFESVLRALALEAAIEVEPQGEVKVPGWTFHPDLVDRDGRRVFEADSFTFHTSREAHARDCVRYNALTLAGWRVFRFTWEQVMLSPAYVRSVLAALAAEPAAA
ncbi:hypothetical protein K8W59_05330 [Nocardioides rotundus]|uniref:hypothetical protein n=1 Tax=Nocardioides rotundus TaxID=1774216 RepID=UPI001CBFF510|nr:hypothetical protein [Nocardioides rotundus]UAL30919.1 hypothetical protein K8W59_05330 [Nocardioides rotundus]